MTSDRSDDEPLPECVVCGAPARYWLAGDRRVGMIGIAFACRDHAESGRAEEAANGGNLTLQPLPDMGGDDGGSSG